MSSFVKQVLIGMLAICFFCSQSLTVFAQAEAPPLPQMIGEKPQPPMQNVFFNVLWGSLTGGMLMMGWSMLDDSKTTDERYTVNNMSSQFLSGATYGGLLGLAVGVYLSFKGITFDENRTKIAFLRPFGQEPFSSVDISKNNSQVLIPQKLRLIDLQYRF